MQIDFQSIFLNLQTYWAKQGCVILQPYDMEVGAGTFHPATTLRSLGPDFIGRQHMCSLHGAQQTGVMVKTQTGFNIIINFRLSSNHLLPIHKNYI